MDTEWRDRARLWDRYASAEPATQALLRLMYQAGLEDGQEVTQADAEADTTIELVITGHLVEVDRLRRRAAFDLGLPVEP